MFWSSIASFYTYTMEPFCVKYRTVLYCTVWSVHLQYFHFLHIKLPHCSGHFCWRIYQRERAVRIVTCLIYVHIITVILLGTYLGLIERHMKIFLKYEVVPVTPELCKSIQFSQKRHINACFSVNLKDNLMRFFNHT